MHISARLHFTLRYCMHVCIYKGICPSANTIHWFVIRVVRDTSIKAFVHRQTLNVIYLHMLEVQIHKLIWMRVRVRT